MLDQHLQHIHQHDREEHARRLGLNLAKFDALVASANQAYEIIKDLGPFYGHEEINEPTFRITAEPVKLPVGSQKLLTELGNDLLHLAKVLHKLPENHKKELGADIDFTVPPTWRIDAIIDNYGCINVNEIEGADGASALMMAEQLAYGMQTLQQSTAAKLIPTLQAMFHPQEMGHHKHKIALIRTITPFRPHTINAKKFIKFLEILSKETITVDLLDAAGIKEGTLKPIWETYAGILNEVGFAPNELAALGVANHQVLSSGDYNAIANKGVFALVFDDSLKEFWETQLGKERHERLQSTLIPSSFIRTPDELNHARSKGNIVKLSWTNINTERITHSKGVALPMEGTEHGSEERWEMLRDMLQHGAKIITQDFVEPAQIPAFLRKKGVSLEPVQWYNRLCVKYVADGNPNDETTTAVSLTAAEVTLGPNIIPAGRKCAFTAGKLQ